MTVQLSEHFTLEEFTHSDTAIARGIDNSAPPDVAANLAQLAAVLEQVRVLLGSKPMVITSGYRCPALNAAVGGAGNSAHLSGRAVDFVCTAFGTPAMVCRAIVGSNIPFDQVILEYGDWTHLGFNPAYVPARRQALTIDENGTREGIHG
jgi:hypothetical protein